MEDFLVRWFLGPLGGRVKGLVMREVGFCGDMGVKGGFRREPLSFEGFLDLLQRLDLRSVNLFMGVGFWLVSRGLEPDPSYMLYDRLAFDFDSGEDPEGAVSAAISFSSILSSKYGVTPVVFRSGFKGAHVVVPLSKPTSWEGYQLLWDHFYGLIPKEHRKLVDTNMKQWNRLDRVPYTYNNKEGRKALAKIIHPEGLTPQNFDWSKLEGLDPGSVTIYKVEVPRPHPRTPKSVKGKARSGVVKEVLAPCMKKLLEDCRNGINLSHNARVALTAYLLNIGFSVDEVVEVFRTQPDFNERVTRYQVNYIASYDGEGKPLIPYSCAKMKEMGLCVRDCGTKNPLNHNKTRNQVELVGVKSVSSSPIESLPPELSDFLRESGLTEFTYEDFRNWLESRQGLLDASEWHHWGRRLRKWAEEGYLGRKFLVNGVWVDYGPGKIAKPPSKEVKFYNHASKQK
ncbi:MAG: hypothetical protein QXT64_04660 [Desulfurococcaceae archaeon]